MSGDVTDVTRRRFLRTTGAVAAGAMATLGAGDAHAAGSDGATGNGPTARDDVLNLVSQRDHSFDPVAAGGRTEVHRQLFDCLTHHPAGTVRVAGQLASSYEFENGGQRLRLRLAEDATFHDGTDVTAADVRYSLERLAGSDHSVYPVFALEKLGIEHDRDGDGTYVPGSLAVSTPDEHTVVLDLQRPHPGTLAMLARLPFAVVPAGLVDDVPGYSGRLSQEAFASERPVGAGPYRLASYEADDHVRVEAVDDYHGPPRRFDGVEWRLLFDATTAYHYSVFEDEADEKVVPRGEYDPEKASVDGFSEESIVTGTYGPLETGDTVDYHASIDDAVFYLGFNQDLVPRPVRRAVASVVNQAAVAEDAVERMAVPATHVTPPALFPGGLAGYRDHEADYPYRHRETDVDRARSVMEAAGYGPDDRYELELSHYPSDAWRRVGRLLREPLSDAHVDLTVVEREFGELFQEASDGRLPMYTFGSADRAPPTPGRYLELLYPPKTDTDATPTGSFTDWSGTPAAARATDAWERARATGPTGGEAVRADAYRTMEAANWEDVVLLPLFHTTTERFWDADVDVRASGPMGAEHRQFVDPAAAGGDGDLARFDADGDDAIEFRELLDAIGAFNEGETVEGEPVGFQELLDAIEAFNDGATV